MARKRLDSAAFGFASDCFVCSPTNAHGLGVAFFHDDETGEVVADFSLGGAFSGAPSYGHGGIVVSILDEAMAWAAIAQWGRFAVTRTLEASFLRPVRIGRPYRARAAVNTPAEAPGTLGLRATIEDRRGRTFAEATAQFVALSAAGARRALGVAPAGPDAGFVRG
ncbi:MAG: PaaI family thioesterase [Acidimicrobiales bacterium]